VRGQQSQRWRRLQAQLEAEPYWRLLGITVEEIGEGYVRLRLPLTASVRNFGSGPAHGGALSSLVDMAVGSALDSLDLPDVVGHVTIDLSVSYLEAAQGEHVTAEGRMLRVGRTIAVGEAEIRDQDGRLLAKGRAAYLIWRREKEDVNTP